MKNWSQKLTYFASGLGVSLSLGGFAFYPWDEANDPDLFGKNYERTLAKLPKANALGVLPWKGPYFQYRRGAFLVRHFYPGGNDGESYRNRGRLTTDQLLRMTPEEMQRLLSPTEVLDILNGNTDPNDPKNFYRITRAEQRMLDSMPYIPDGWEGHCQGWAPAALAFGEMEGVYIPVQLRRQDGTNAELKIPVTPYMWKALLIRYYGRLIADNGERLHQYVDQMGGNCGGGPLVNGCPAMNAGAFHIVLANEVLPGRNGVVADLSPGSQIWNHPIFAYRIVGQKDGLPVYRCDPRDPRSCPSPQAVSETRIDLEMEYQIESEAGAVVTGVLGKRNYPIKKRKFSYHLELDESGKIVGGRWLSGEVPDLLWKMPRYKLTGDYAVLARYLERAEEKARERTGQPKERGDR